MNYKLIFHTSYCFCAVCKRAVYYANKYEKNIETETNNDVYERM